ncbi:Nup133 N terminal like-domain-containing protein [Lipomyces kononenkoae]|uniref:Nup133 N terminal like-domain-containing protein n=1 Tax=Lipomyces kononenkoae TaxID=34357 RepID=A0ACC3T617_LIPKO
MSIQIVFVSLSTHRRISMAQRRSARLQARRSRQVSGLLRFPDNTSTALVPVRQTTTQPETSRARDSVMEYTKNAKYCALKLPAVPNILKVKDDESCTGFIDSGTESALLVTPTTAYVWKYSSPDRIPTAISFPISNASGAQPLGVLVSPSAGSTEPGLVLVNPTTGHLTYWDAVGGALAEGLLHRKKGMETTIQLYQSETLEYLQNIEPAGVIVATSTGRFVLVALHDGAGRPGVACTAMRGAGTGLWSNIVGFVKVGSTRRDVVAMKPAKLLGRGERMVVTANARGAVTMWHCSRTGDYRLVFEMDLREQLISSIAGVYPQAEKTFRVHDIEMLPNDENTGLLLSSFVYDEDDEEKIYYVLFTAYFDSGDFRIISAHRITCYTMQSTRPPRLLLPGPGYTAFVILSNAVIMLDTVLKSDSNISTRFKWEDVIQFKPDVQVMSAGTEDLSQINGQVTRHAGIVTVTRGAGVIRIERFEDESDGNAVRSTADVIKSKLEQAVYYGFIDESPLDFGKVKQVGYDINDIETAISDVSDEIFNGTSLYMQVDDTMTCLTLRCQALGRLAEHLSLIFSSLSAEIRYQVLYKLEKCEAAKNLYELWFTSPASSSRSGMLAEVLSDMTQGSGSVDSFFRNDMSKFGDLIAAFSNKCLIRARTASGHRNIMLQHVREANEFLLTVLSSSAYVIRSHYKESIFKLSNAWAVTAPWTSTFDILNSLSRQFEVTKTVCTSLWEASDASDEQVATNLRDLCDQLVGLAQALCRAYEERISFCEAAESRREQAENLKRAYVEQRPGWLKPLLAFGCGEQAFQLGEQYRDFRTLAEMCREEKMQLDEYSDEASRLAKEKLAIRTKYYFDTYGYEFAQTLYQYYVDAGYTSELFISFPDYREYLERFLSDRKYDRVAWIHDIQTGDFINAGKKLVNVAEKMEDPLSNKRLQLSIAKLCLISSASVGGDQTQDDIRYINEELDRIDRLDEEDAGENEAMEE